jgi:Ser/Thr protein kinase RdoA (MazF antagonist)
MGATMSERTVQQIVLECLAENYGVRGCELQRLPGENLNFLATCRQGGRYVLKIVGEDIPPPVVEMEKAVIEHAVSRGFKVRLPQNIENKIGKIETGISLHTNGPYRLRLLRFLEGKVLAGTSDISNKLLEQVGKSLALFNRALQDFDHPAARRNHRWNLATADQHEAKIQLIGDGGRRELLAWAYNGWHASRKSMNHVPWQLIHGDAHDENWIIEDGRVTGLVDFGDSCHNPAVCDLAICLAYLMMRGVEPLPTAAAVVKGYRRIRPLAAEELGLLFPLAAARLAVSVCVSADRKAVDAGNPNWFASEESAWRLLDMLRGIGSSEFVQFLQKAQ